MGKVQQPFTVQRFQKLTGEESIALCFIVDNRSKLFDASPGSQRIRQKRFEVLLLQMLEFQYPRSFSLLVLFTYNPHEWMGGIHRFLGLTVGTIVHGISDAERQEAYGADITYATNNELGFDYLRDNMKLSAESCVQRELHYAIVDEVDSILIDEARTPLIISGQSEEDTRIYGVANRLIPSLKAGTKGEPSKGIEETGDYWLDEKAHSATLTEVGIHKVEKMLGVPNLYDPQMLPILHAVNQALSAHTLKKKDVDYIVELGETGRFDARQPENSVLVAALPSAFGFLGDDEVAEALLAPAQAFLSIIMRGIMARTPMIPPHMASSVI